MGTRSSTRILLAVVGGTFLVTFDGSAVQMILPALRRQLHTSIYVVQWTMTAFLVVTTAAYLPAGRLGDLRGRGAVWQAGMATFLVGSTACALAPGVGWLILARVVQALAPRRSPPIRRRSSSPRFPASAGARSGMARWPSPADC